MSEGLHMYRKSMSLKDEPLYLGRMSNGVKVKVKVSL